MQASFGSVPAAASAQHPPRRTPDNLAVAVGIGVGVLGEQVPLLPPVSAAVQAWQVPLHAVSQQTPSAQWPVVQSVSAAQAVPLVSVGTQALLLQ